HRVAAHDEGARGDVDHAGAYRVVAEEADAPLPRPVARDVHGVERLAETLAAEDHEVAPHRERDRTERRRAERPPVPPHDLEALLPELADRHRRPRRLGAELERAVPDDLARVLAVVVLGDEVEDERELL